MSRSAVLEQVTKKQLKNNIPNFAVGDTVCVHVRIVEAPVAQEKGGGAKTAEKGGKGASKAATAEKERIQAFTGTVIARKGSGLSETFSLHRIAYGEGMERVFLLHSPKIATIEVVKKGVVRRSKLYYLRKAKGKKAKVQERLGALGTESAAEEATSEASAG